MFFDSNIILGSYLSSADSTGSVLLQSIHPESRCISVLRYEHIAVLLVSIRKPVAFYRFRLIFIRQNHYVVLTM